MLPILGVHPHGGSSGRPYTFSWDAAADGFAGEYARLRISVDWQAPRRVAGPLTRPQLSAISPPFRISPTPKLWKLYRLTVADATTGWKSSVGLPLGPGSMFDGGWPRQEPVPLRLDDASPSASAPLVLYRLLNDAEAPVGNRLFVVEAGPGGVQVQY